jgi:hypothetical protein
VTQAGLIRNRLQTMQRGLWQIIRDSANPDAVQALFAATIKYSPLIADFLDQVVRQELHRLSDTLRPVLWDRFIDDCELRDPAVAGWSASTREKLRQNAFQMLAEVGIISDTRNRQLRPLTLAAAVRDYLCEHHEHDILRCLELNP